jgi:hypothetical protein
MENNNIQKTALILSIFALVSCHLILLNRTILGLFDIYSIFGDSLTALVLAGAPITMGSIALSLIKTAQNPKRVFVILVRVFSIVAISLGGLLLLVALSIAGLFHI